MSLTFPCRGPRGTARHFEICFKTREEFMRLLTLGLAAAFVFAASAAYADDVMSNTYGNTITTKDTKTGATATLLFNADGSYVTNGTGADGKPVSYPGHWV